MTKEIHILAATLLSAIFMASPAFGGTPMKTAEEIVAEQPELAGRLIQVQVNGMVCDFCAQSLSKVLKKKDAVEDVHISLETKLMIITQKEGLTISDEEVAEAVSWAGYDLAGIERF